MSRLSIAVFTGYVVLASTGWVLESVWPSSLPWGEISFLASLLLCSIVVLLPLPGRISWRPLAWGSALRGIVVFACAWALSGLVGGGLPGLTRSALFTLVPVGVVLVGAAQESADLDFLALMGAALAGVGGVFLLLPADPEALLRRPAATAAVLAVVCGLSCGSYGVYSAMRVMDVRAGTLLVLLPGVVLNGVAAVFSHEAFRLPGLGDLPGIVWQAGEIALLLFLLRGVRPVPLAARFLLVPLVGAGEGWLYLRPALTWRVVLGVGLLVFGSVRLLREGAGAGRDSSLSLL